MIKNICQIFFILIFCIHKSFSKESVMSWNIYNFRGQYVTNAQPPQKFGDEQSTGLSSILLEILRNSQFKLSSGFYRFLQSQSTTVNSQFFANNFDFIDITNQALPAKEWEAGDVEAADVNHDNRYDIIFSLYSSFFHENFDYRPRILMQNNKGCFVDETDNRIPALSPPCQDIELVDVDDDGNVDIFLTGYLIPDGYYVPAALLINDGTGIFSNQSHDRLPELPSDHFAYFSETAKIDDNLSIDLILIIFNSNSYTTYPVIWLNDGNGFFIQDTTRRLPADTNYGFFQVTSVDINMDGQNDILFANHDLMFQGFNTQNACYVNTGAGYFVDETSTRMPQINSNTYYLKSVDLDNDNDCDLVEVDFSKDWGGYDPQVRMLTNDGAGYFSHASSLNTGIYDHFNDSEFAILNDDDRPDLFMTKVTPGAVNALSYDVLLINNGDLSFRDNSFSLPENLDFSISCALFDYQNDNDIDIVVANSGHIAGAAGKNVFYQNMLNTANIGMDEKLNTDIFWLSPNYPNPFNLSTTINFYVPQSGEVKLQIFDTRGKLVDTLVHGYKTAGNYKVEWHPVHIASGIYFYKITSGRYSASKKCTILK